jgi:hypothetical protein
VLGIQGRALSVLSMPHKLPVLSDILHRSGGVNIDVALNLSYTTSSNEADSVRLCAF